ncbi:MAG: thermonuclease family protein [Lentisphaeria bacterium]|nr:thermonuclease family protein [Lentisphaeria bacterium]
MAKKRSGGGRGKSGEVSAVKSGLWSRARRYAGSALLILLGGLIFNLDRMGDLGDQVGNFQRLMPYRIRRFIPWRRHLPVGMAQKNEVLTGRVTEVYDGDTITLHADGKNYRIRFYGIDAPEAKQQDGIASRDVLRDKILGQDVTVTVKNIDRYGRAVGQVSFQGRNINLEMVREGQAWYYKNFAQGERDLEDAQRIAQENRLGLWQSPSPMPPWKYRELNRK